jgi:hypothetical protein
MEDDVRVFINVLADKDGMGIDVNNVKEKMLHNVFFL